MKFPSDCKPWAICSKKTGRYDFQYCMLKGNKLYATDGRALSSVKVELEAGDVDGFVTVDALKRAAKHGDYSVGCPADELHTSDGVRERRPTTDEGTFPTIELVIPKNIPSNYCIGLNVKNLRALVDALDTSENFLTLRWDDDKSPILIHTASGQAFGLTMPVKPNDLPEGIL